VSGQRQVPPLALAVNRSRQADQQDAQGDAHRAGEIAEAERERRCDQQRRRQHLERGVDVNRDCSEQTHREKQGTNVCAIRV
jgi:hypothetical protein